VRDRAAIGPLWPSVFMTPVREALLAADHHAASAINRDRTGQGISIQAFALKPKLLQIEHWARQTHVRVVEIHPEVCFARLAGAPLTARKSSWTGVERRRALLASAGIGIAGDLGGAGTYAAVDDVLDAGAAAWAARKVLLGQAKPIPDRLKSSATAGRAQSGHDQTIGGRSGRSLSEERRYSKRLGWPPIRSGIEKRQGVVEPSLTLDGRQHAEP